MIEWRGVMYYYKYYSIAMVSTKELQIQQKKKPKELQRLLEILAAEARGHQNAKVCWKQL